MKVLVLGSGAREHAMCWSLANSPLITRLFCAPGNPGIEEEAECIDLNINNNNDIISFKAINNINLYANIDANSLQSCNFVNQI